MISKIDQFIEDYCRDNLFSGSLRITLRDEIIYQRFIGMENEEQQLPLTEASRFNFYSLTKPFCAIGLLKLKDRGLVQLDEHPGVFILHVHEFIRTDHVQFCKPDVQNATDSFDGFCT